MKPILEIGKNVRVNVYGTIYDGQICDMDKETITLEENCGSAKLYKILYRHNIAAIELRVQK